MGCSTYGSGRLRLQSRLGRFHLTSSPPITAHGSFVQLPILQSATISARGSVNLSQSRLTEVSPVLHPRPPTARAMRLRVLLDATWLLQQGIRTHRFPLSCLSSSPRPLVHSSHRLHNRFFPSSVPLCTINIYSYQIELL